MEKKPVHTIIDGVNLTARHFVKFSREKAIEKMIADGISVPGTEGKVVSEEWAGKAYDKMKQDVESADAPPVKKEEAGASESEERTEF